MSRGINSQRFDDLLNNSSDPVKAALRGKILYILHTQGEILPSAESALGKLWDLLNSGQASLDDCEDLIKLDPILTTRIFRIANSAAYAADATNIADALFHLGFIRLREITFTSGVFSKLASLKLSSRWDVFWLRNIFIARMVQRLFASVGKPDGTEYLAGLLHDTGWLFLIKYFPELVDQIVNFPGSLAEAELNLLPFSHADISGALAARSGMPLRTVYAIFHHAQAPSKSYRDTTDLDNSARFLGAIIHLCERIAATQQMDLFNKPEDSLISIEESSEMAFILPLGSVLNLSRIVEEEMAQARELYEVYLD